MQSTIAYTCEASSKFEATPLATLVRRPNFPERQFIIRFNRTLVPHGDFQHAQCSRAWASHARTPTMDDSSPALALSGVFDAEALAQRAWQSKRGVSRAQRVESSWEDVSSDEEEAANSREMDDWEDESSSDEESDSAQSSTTASGATERGRDVGAVPATSARKALRDYRQSKRALMLSESNNMEKYNRLMNADKAAAVDEQEVPEYGKQTVAGERTTAAGEAERDLRRTDTADLLETMEPFSAGRGTEAVDDADPVGRAHEIYLDEAQRTVSTPSRQSSHHSRRGSSNASRSPYPDARRSPSVAKSVLDVGSEEENAEMQQEKKRLNGIAKEIYASEPASPVPKEVGEATHALGEGDAALLSAPSARPGPTPEMLSAQLDQLADAAPPLSLWDYLKEEVMATDFDSTQELKWERVTNFIAIPFWMEKIMVFGFAVCLDSFLYTFTILPLRALVALYMWARNSLLWAAGGQKRYLHSSHKCDILKALLIVLSCYILSRITDASKMYHSVRGQDVVKLYVIFNVLEIADRLCCSFGQDLLDSLFSRLTLARRKDGRQPYLRPLGFFLLSLGYVLAHTLVLFYQLVTLNVAINSYDNALLTLLLSNQFVEIKGSVFKKFEKENLFQLTCADIVERFQLTLMLSAIGLRNLIEVSGAAGNSAAVAKSNPLASASSLSSALNKQTMGAGSIVPSPLSAAAILGPLPTSFTVFPSFTLLETTFTPVCIVLASECLVDWLKHAFITKFNHIRPSVYGRFMDVLCRDLTIAGGAISSRRRHTFVDQSPVVSRRLGFAALPLACLLVRITSQIMGMLKDDSHFDECAVPDMHRHGGPEGQGSTAFAWNLLRSSMIFFLRAFVRGADAKVDLALAFLVRGSAWILTILIAWILCVCGGVRDCVLYLCC